MAFIYQALGREAADQLHQILQLIDSISGIFTGKHRRQQAEDPLPGQTELCIGAAIERETDHPAGPGCVHCRVP